MGFQKYQHIERFGTAETSRIEIVKAHKMPTIDFKRLKNFVFSRVKTVKPELF